MQTIINQARRPNNMSDLRKIGTQIADKERLYKALKELHSDGVRLIDDRGRPEILSSESVEAAVAAQSNSEASLTLEQLEASYEIEESTGIDPYNKGLK